MSKTPKKATDELSPRCCLRTCRKTWPSLPAATRHSPLPLKLTGLGTAKLWALPVAAALVLYHKNTTTPPVDGMPNKLHHGSTWFPWSYPHHPHHGLPGRPKIAAIRRRRPVANQGGEQLCLVLEASSARMEILTRPSLRMGANSRGKWQICQVKMLMVHSYVGDGKREDWDWNVPDISEIHVACRRLFLQPLTIH